MYSIYLTPSQAQRTTKCCADPHAANWAFQLPSQASQLPHLTVPTLNHTNQAISATTAANAFAGSAAWLIGRPITK